jgi:hypothetical protein
LREAVKRATFWTLVLLAIAAVLLATLKGAR